jgi:Uma2 family endonuclease
MVAMTTTEPWPAAGQFLTVDDLERTRDDGRRYELVDGVLIVSPAPRISHQEVLGELLVQLREACPPGLAAVPGPGVRMSVDTELIPDLVVIRHDRPELIAFDLREGHYEQVVHVTDSQVFGATRPFDVEVVPARLVAGLLPG